MDRPSPRSFKTVPLAVVGLAVIASACASPTPFPPRSPLAIANSPAPPVVEGGTRMPDAVATVTPAGSPTAAPTVFVPPPEPLELPPGFAIGVFANLGLPVSMMAVAPNGDLFASVPAEDRIIVMPDRDQNGQVDALPTGQSGPALVFAAGRGLSRPWGLAFGPDALYVAGTDAVWAFDYRPGQVLASGAPRRLVDLPGGGPNWERGLALGPDGRLYISVGASCASCQPEDARSAGVLSLDLAGGQNTRFAAGLRRSLDLAFHPRSRELFAGDQGREGLGDDLPPDELNRLSAGAHYGWPGCFGAGRPDGAAEAPGDAAFCAATTAPLVALPAHGAVSGLVFYTGEQFPADYRGDLYVATHGSDARRELPVGYSVLRIPMEGDLPRGEVFDFVSGWLRPDTRRWGGPVDLAQARDGSLLISDDRGGLIYRVFSTLPPPTPAPQQP